MRQARKSGTIFDVANVAIQVLVLPVVPVLYTVPVGYSVVVHHGYKWIDVR